MEEEEEEEEPPSVPGRDRWGGATANRPSTPTSTSTLATTKATKTAGAGKRPARLDVVFSLSPPSKLLPLSASITMERDVADSGLRLSDHAGVEVVFELPSIKNEDESDGGVGEQNGREGAPLPSPSDDDILLSLPAIPTLLSEAASSRVVAAIREERRAAEASAAAARRIEQLRDELERATVAGASAAASAAVASALRDRIVRLATAGQLDEQGRVSFVAAAKDATRVSAVATSAASRAMAGAEGAGAGSSSSSSASSALPLSPSPPRQQQMRQQQLRFDFGWASPLWQQQQRQQQQRQQPGQQGQQQQDQLAPSAALAPFASPLARPAAPLPTTILDLDLDALSRVLARCSPEGRARAATAARPFSLAARALPPIGSPAAETTLPVNYDGEEEVVLRENCLCEICRSMHAWTQLPSGVKAAVTRSLR